MPTALENLITARENLIAELARESASPKPSYNIDGQSEEWTAYRDSLIQRIEDLRLMILREGDDGGESEIVSEMGTW